MTTGSSPVASSTASLMSDSTQSAWVWAISTAPVDAGRGGGELVPVDSRTPTSTGSMPSRAQARSRNDIAGSTSQSHPLVGEQRAHRALEHERRAGHGVQHLAVLDGGGDERLDDRRVDVVEAVGRLVEVVERRRRPARGRRSGAGPCAGSGAGCARSPRSVSTVTCSWPPGPSPTTTTSAGGDHVRRRHDRRRRGASRPSARSAGRRWTSAVAEVAGEQQLAGLLGEQRLERLGDLVERPGSMTCHPSDVSTGPSARRPRRLDGASTNVRTGLGRRGGERHAARRPSDAPPVSAAAGSIERSAASSAKSAPRVELGERRRRPRSPSRRGCAGRTARRGSPATRRSRRSSSAASGRGDARPRPSAPACRSTNSCTTSSGRSSTGSSSGTSAEHGVAVRVGDRLAGGGEELLVGRALRPSPSAGCRPASPATVPVAGSSVNWQRRLTSAKSGEHRLEVVA